MKNVLIPTDYTPGSLGFLNIVARTMPEKINILFFHAFDMPGSLLEAMSRAGINSHNSLVTEEMRVRCKRIKLANPNINNISFRAMYGTTTAAFNNFAKANDIHVIALPIGYRFVPVTRDSVSPERMFRKSGIQILSDLSETSATIKNPA